MMKTVFLDSFVNVTRYNLIRDEPYEPIHRRSLFAMSLLSPNTYAVTTRFIRFITYEIVARHIDKTIHL